MSYITTYTRKHFDPVHPDPERICIQDIAHALPLICRGNGHVSTFWSVGEHCICCAKEALGRGYSNRQALACLLHDASECYMSDVPRPLKQEMPRYREVEEQLLQVIYKKFLGSSLTDEEAQHLKEINAYVRPSSRTVNLDREAFEFEASVIIPVRNRIRTKSCVENQSHKFKHILKRKFHLPADFPAELRHRLSAVSKFVAVEYREQMQVYHCLLYTSDAADEL